VARVAAAIAQVYGCPEATSQKREVAHPSYFFALASNPRDTYAPQMLATRRDSSSHKMPI